MKYTIEFETDDPSYAAAILRELSNKAEQGEPDCGDIYSKSFGAIIGEWDYSESSTDEDFE